jgi:hypothetical protein
MFRTIIALAVVVLFSPTTSGFGQMVAARDADELVGQLHPITERLLDNSRDLASMRKSLRSCDNNSVQATTLSMATSKAIDHVQFLGTVLSMYALIPTPVDPRITLWVDREGTYTREWLEEAIAEINGELGDPSISPGFAVLGSQIRDNIRAALKLLPKDTRR